MQILIVEDTCQTALNQIFPRCLHNLIKSVATFFATQFFLNCLSKAGKDALLSPPTFSTPYE